MIFITMWWILCGLVATAISIIVGDVKLDFKLQSIGILTLAVCVNVCFGILALIGALILLWKKNDSST